MKWVFGVELLAMVGALIVAGGQDRPRILAVGIATCLILGAPFNQLAADHSVSQALTVPLAAVGAVATLLLWRAALRARRSEPHSGA